MIQVQGISKVFGELKAVDNISFSVDEGEVVGFLGPNGAGKTTTMRIITCFSPATQGTVKIGGFDIFNDSLEIRRLIGYLPEKPPIYMDMTVQEYLNFVGRIKNMPWKGLDKKIQEVMERVRITEYANTLTTKLSKGYKQRLGLAQALINEPKILIMDEPTSGLDPAQIIEVRQLIRELKDRHTVILSTHILSEVQSVCGKLVIINKGRIVAEDKIDNLTRGNGATWASFRTGEGLKKVFESLQPVAADDGIKLNGTDEGLTNITVIPKDPHEDIRAIVGRSIVEAGLDLVELRWEATTIEEVYLKLTMETGTKNAKSERYNNDSGMEMAS